MADDFVRLVSQANPAFRQQYQPANGGGYPPSSSFHNPADSAQLDPFFDDEDDVPDSAFGRPQAMMSKESGLPLAKSAAAPAGHGDIAPDGDILQDWDDEPATATKRFSASVFPGSSSRNANNNQARVLPKQRRKWKWPWKKEQEVLSGERVIALNNPTANVDFCSNYVSTSKYNAATFLPKFLYGASLSYLV